jgi:hypothetical protein
MKTLKSQLIPQASRTPASPADQIECSPHALKVRDLMAFLKVSDQTIYRMIADQTIPFLTSGTRTDLTQNKTHFAPAFFGNEYTGIEDYSHERISRGLRLLMICSRSAAKSGSSVGS